ALAAHVENANGGKLTEAEMRKLYDAGYEAGVRAAENKQHGDGDFRNVDRALLPAEQYAAAGKRTHLRQRHGEPHGVARTHAETGEVAAQHLLSSWRENLMDFNPPTI